MTTTKRCDRCGLVDIGIGWLSLERRVVQLYQEPASWDFCTWTCLEIYAADKAQAEAGRFS